MKLRKRRPLFTPELRNAYHAFKAFHAPQRDKVKRPMPPREKKA